FIYDFFFFSSRRRHTRFSRDWSSDVCSSDLSTAKCPRQGSIVFIFQVFTGACTSESVELVGCRSSRSALFPSIPVLSMQSLWMLLASLMFAAMGACIKFASDLQANLSQIVLFRGTPSVVLLLGWALLTHRSLRPKNWRLHVMRNVTGVSSMWMGFFAISVLPLATAVSLNYTSPLFIAGWMLARDWKQRDGVRTLAVLFGFAGVLAVLRPS